eukprot:5765367-Ditylum_brightwellii.AAC.1
MCVVGDKGNGVGNSVGNSEGGANKHLTHLSLANDRHLMERNKHIECVDCDKDDGVDNSDDDSVGGGDKQFTHLTQVENNVNLGVCD